MKKIFQEILDWSEVWAPLIPLFILFYRKSKERWVRPLKYYLVFAFVINMVGDIIWKRMHLGLESWMQENLAYFYNKDGSLDNTLLYNIHSLLRFIFFAWFFQYMNSLFRKINMVVPALFLGVAAITFIFIRDIQDFSSLLLATEAALLLLYSLFYYFIMLRNEESHAKRPPSFWAVTGLSIYVVINFPIFLFYNVLSRQAENFAIDIWDVHNISYIIFCLFIAKSFYG